MRASLKTGPHNHEEVLCQTWGAKDNLGAENQDMTIAEPSLEISQNPNV